MKQVTPIMVWPFSKAPKNLRDLSTNGGDEDWLALVPKQYVEDYYIGWLEEGSSFGICSIDLYILSSGDLVYIGRHS